MKIIFTILLIFTLFICTPAIARKRTYPAGMSSMTKVSSKDQKHFDRNADGYLNPYELSLFHKYQRLHYPLAKKKKEWLFDVDKDGMLDPEEMRRYQK